MPVFSIPLSGLTASSTALATIANNLANLNTVGYKQSRVTFRDLFYQTVGSTGSGNPLQIGAGTAVGSINTIFTGGNVETSGVPTDVAITGDGFFVISKDGGEQFTRAGNFSVDPAGWLVTQDGYQVMGYPVVNGAVDATSGLSALQLGKGQINPPNATSYLRMNSNLDAGAAIGEVYSTPITVYDSLGASHVLKFNFTKTAANTWNYDVTIPGADVGAATAQSIKTGQLTFDGAGKLTSPVADIAGLSITGLADGASTLTLDWHLFDSGGSAMMTQMAAPSTTSTSYQDGFATGTLLEFAIGQDGTIQGSFTNGTKVLGQIALANFSNQEGLQRVGRNNFAGSLASGQPVFGAPATGGRGTLSGGALELSNVDISREFANLITAQRGFQANARVVTTFDEITQETINLKR